MTDRQGTRYPRRPQHHLTDGEHDTLSWVDEAAGLECRARRHRSLGHWCAYVAVPDGHPLHGHGDGMGSKAHDLDVHGGVTYGHLETWDGDTEERWWIGWDYAHLGDRSPWGSPGVLSDAGDTYHRQAEVIGDVEAAAGQVKEYGLVDGRPAGAHDEAGR